MKREFSTISTDTTEDVSQSYKTTQPCEHIQLWGNTNLETLQIQLRVIPCQNPSILSKFETFQSYEEWTKMQAFLTIQAQDNKTFKQNQQFQHWTAQAYKWIQTCGQSQLCDNEQHKEPKPYTIPVVNNKSNHSIIEHHWTEGKSTTRTNPKPQFTAQGF